MRTPVGAGGYAEALPGGVVLLRTSQAVLDVLRSLQAADELDRRNGYAPVVRRRWLIQMLAGALAEADATAVTVSAELPSRTDVPAFESGDLVEVAEAARLLGVGHRQVRNLAAELGGRKVKGRWWLDRAAVQGLAAHRRCAERETP